MLANAPKFPIDNKPGDSDVLRVVEMYCAGSRAGAIRTLLSVVSYTKGAVLVDVALCDRFVFVLHEYQSISVVLPCLPVSIVLALSVSRFFNCSSVNAFFLSTYVPLFSLSCSR